MEPTIRPEKREDIPDIHELVALAFGEESEAKLVDLLRESEHYIPGLSLVAILDNQIVGHILFTRIKIVDDDGHEVDSLALAPMAVRPDLQRKGIGGQLVHAGLERARALNFTSVIVLGHEHYYPRFGFLPAEKWGIKAPFEVPPGVFMALELVKGGLEKVSGTVKYPKAFDIV